MEWIGSNYQFSVKNVTRCTWSGYVRLRIITKKKAESGNGGETTDPSEQEDYDEITPGLRAEDNYVYVYSEEIKNLQPGKSTMVSLSLDNVFPPGKKDWYYIYFESIGKWNIDPKGSEQLKDIGIDYDYSITENPILRKIDKNSLVIAQEKLLMQDAEFAANVILAYCSKLSQFDGVIGNVPYIDWKLKSKGLEKYPSEIQKLSRLLEYSAGTEMFVELFEDGEMQKFLSEVFTYEALDLASKYHEDLVKDILKYSGGAKEYLSEALRCLQYIKIYRNWEQMNDYDQFFYAADAILDAADSYWSNPLCKMLKVYSKVGRSLAQKAHELGDVYYENYAPSELIGNVDTENKFAYNINVDFKIMVVPDYWFNVGKFEYFNFEKNGTEPIREVVVKVHNNSVFPNSVATLFFDLIPVSDGVMLKQTSIQNANGLDDGRPIDRMWMEIKWKNGRITKVPLRADIDGVDLGNSPHNATVKQYTVYLHSDTSKFMNMADEIEIKK